MQPLWSPSPGRVSHTQMFTFAQSVGRPDYPALHAWSVQDPDAFWPAVWEHCGMPGRPGAPIEPGDWFGATRYFPEAALNAAEVILDGRGATADAPMWIEVDEAGGRRVMSRGDARRLVAETAAALRADGVGVGDRVAAWMPNVIETMVLMLATSTIGAVFSSTSPDFGTAGVLDRFGQIEPVVLVAASGYRYGGKQIDCRDKLVEVIAALPSVRRTVVLPYGGVDPAVGGTTTWADWTAARRGAEAEFVQLPFDHPWYVLFSSGTTGVPKCIVHRTGGVLLQHLKEHQLHADIRPGDRVLYFTTCGWMMWNWLASVPASGATAVLYEGSPSYPSPNALFDLAGRERLTYLGVGAKLIDSSRKAGISPIEVLELPELRTVASTGSPLSVEGFEWVYEHVKADVHLTSISGGTDICGCFVGGDPTSPVFAGEIQRPALGMAIGVRTDAGKEAAVGERGELVCTQPFPSMPLGFWGDDDGGRYRAAYYDRFPGIWAQGDFASWTEHGGMIIHGRSDATLNPGGVRIGTAEIYRQVERHAEVAEALVFAQDWDDDTRVVLLVRLQSGVELTDEIVAEIKAQIRRECTPRHVPALVVAVDDLPRTRSGKLAELAVADAVNGREVRNTAALANPEAITAIARHPALSSS
ncbi:MAG: acsA2 [Actinomycetia bacterium]|nr:acsA2 [Actinomycetes bacterium]